MRCRAAVVCLTVLLLLVGGCKPQPATLILASTTSTADTGLLDVINAAFEEEYPQYRVKTIAVGTGEALKMGERKEADVVLVHARAAEDVFVAAGYGFDRRDVMYNDFVLVGPPTDPAGTRGLAPRAALAAIAGEATFVSRGDRSGTHQKELALWAEAGVSPAGAWYLETGQGMGSTLLIASEKQAYTLADRGTFLATANLDLVVLVEKYAALLNFYGVIQVTGAADAAGAEAYCDFITSPQGQAIINEFGVDRYGQPLFFPNAR
ncbi:MAG: substrate-binding domain-containing protein [bacterium]|nr:substrate-binding domain-containing protein [bacterium]